MATVLLIRHGRTAANAAGLLAGWTPGVDLDDKGRDQARALGARLVDVPLALLVSSPLTRCLQTADLVLTGRGVPRREDERLGECRYGAWTGRPIAELVTEPLWRVVQTQPSAARFPDGPEHPGESIRAMAARAVAAVRECDAAVEAEHGPGAVWAAVSHGDVLKAVLADAAGCPLDLFQRWHVDPASVSVVRYTDQRPFVLRTNDTAGTWSALPAVAPHAAASGDAVVGGGAGADS
ncbi:MAG: MSMEG_4193 family putative phosphomutase [Austwickia sp.]|nr:MSMEG_4193 family putative phosphomutase [Actinomycetota bacterium]MCB1254413.1 MSMEG_4193 family putative phosphomutase [Austwickia sp.]MCO5308141.1 MSMEG_4193 family putative phosphomutase [Austwickia sp.]